MNERAADSRQQAAETETETPPSPAVLARRRFLTKVSIALGGFGALAVGAPVVGFLIAPLFRKQPRAWRPVGAADNFQVGTTVEVVVSDPSPLPWTGIAANTAVVAAARGRDDLRRLLGQLHAPRLPGALAAGREPLPLPVPRGRLLQGRHRRRRATAAAVHALYRCASPTGRWRSRRARCRLRGGQGQRRKRIECKEQRGLRLARPSSCYLLAFSLLLPEGRAA